MKIQGDTRSMRLSARKAWLSAISDCLTPYVCGGRVEVIISVRNKLAWKSGHRVRHSKVQYIHILAQSLLFQCCKVKHYLTVDANLNCAPRQGHLCRVAGSGFKPAIKDPSTQRASQSCILMGTNLLHVIALTIEIFVAHVIPVTAA